jgi:hypothetical protein
MVEAAMGEWSHKSRYAHKQQGGGRAVGAMGTRLWEDHAPANYYLDRFGLAATCIHLIREGWKEPRSIV